MEAGQGGSPAGGVPFSFEKGTERKPGGQHGGFHPPIAVPLDPGKRPGGGTVLVGWQNQKAVAARIGLALEQLRLPPLGI